MFSIYYYHKASIVVDSSSEDINSFLSFVSTAPCIEYSKETSLIKPQSYQYITSVVSTIEDELMLIKIVLSSSDTIDALYRQFCSLYNKDISLYGEYNGITYPDTSYLTLGLENQKFDIIRLAIDLRSSDRVSVFMKSILLTLFNEAK